MTDSDAIGEVGHEEFMMDPHEFWQLAPDHMLNEDGHPMDAVIGDYHILYTVMSHPDRDEPRPDYQVHDVEHNCIAHMHEHGHARMVCGVLSALARGYSDGMASDFEDADLYR